jgi:hypothetical protein
MTVAKATRRKATMSKTQTKIGSVNGLTDDEREDILKAKDPKVHVRGMSRAELREILADAGFVGAANLRRPDAEAQYLVLKSGKAFTVHCDKSGVVHKGVSAAEAPSTKPSATKRAPAKRTATKKATPKKATPRKATARKSA